MKLSIQEIADLKEGRKTLDEITKTHDGTSMGGLRNNIKDIVKEYAKTIDRRTFIFNEKGDKIAYYIGDWETDKNGIPKIKYDKLNERNLDLIKTVSTYNEDYAGTGQHNNNLYGLFDDNDGGGGRFPKDDNTFTPFRPKDMTEFLKKDDEGNYYFRSTTLVSTGGKTMSLVKNNNFTKEDEKLFNKISREFQKDIDNYITEDKTFYEYISEKGYENKFADCNVRFVIHKNEDVQMDDRHYKP